MSPVQRPDRSQILTFETAEALRAWFEANHATATEIFIGLYRAGVPKRSVTYAAAVEEALCFGWIDGISFGIDDELRAQRFTPRRPTSTWSATNIARIAELTAAGRMHPAGIRAFETRDRRKDASYSYERPALELPAEWTARLEADPAARAFWEGETKTYRRQAADWVMSAKRPETRERRFAELLESAAAGRRACAWLVSRQHREAAGLTSGGGDPS